jgi:hypothetical protein
MIAATLYRLPVVRRIEVAREITGMWWLYFRRGGKLVGVAIIEAPTLYHARASGRSWDRQAHGVQRWEGAQ